LVIDMIRKWGVRRDYARLANHPRADAALVDDPVAVRGDRDDLRHRAVGHRPLEDLIDSAAGDRGHAVFSWLVRGRGWLALCSAIIYRARARGLGAC
jgi:hypothetical protein